MAERPEDLNLPLSVITRIMKDAIPEGVSVSKEARNAVSKAASVFVLYATSCANTHALKSKRKTLNATDVFAALDDMEFTEFTEPLRANLEVFRASLKNKKEASEQRKKNKEEQDTSKEEEEGEEGEEDDEDDDEDVDDEDDMDDDDEDDDGDDDDVEEVDDGGEVDGGEGGGEGAGEGAGEELVTVEDEEAESPEVEEIVDK